MEPHFLTTHHPSSTDFKKSKHDDEFDKENEEFVEKSMKLQNLEKNKTRTVAMTEAHKNYYNVMLNREMEAKNELNLDLGLVNAYQNKTAERYGPKIEDTIVEKYLITEKIDKEKEKQDTILIHIKRLEREILNERNKKSALIKASGSGPSSGGAFAVNETSLIKKIDTIEGRLHREKSKLNNTLSNNANMRAEISTLKLEKQKFQRKMESTIQKENEILKRRSSIMDACKLALDQAIELKHKIRDSMDKFANLSNSKKGEILEMELTISQIENQNKFLAIARNPRNEYVREQAIRQHKEIQELDYQRNEHLHSLEEAWSKIISYTNPHVSTRLDVRSERRQSLMDCLADSKIAPNLILPTVSQLGIVADDEKSSLGVRRSDFRSLGGISPRPENTPLNSDRESQKIQPNNLNPCPNNAYIPVSSTMNLKTRLSKLKFYPDAEEQIIEKFNHAEEDKTELFKTINEQEKIIKNIAEEISLVRCRISSEERKASFDYISRHAYDGCSYVDLRGYMRRGSSLDKDRSDPIDIQDIYNKIMDQEGRAKAASIKQTFYGQIGNELELGVSKLFDRIECDYEHLNLPLDHVKNNVDESENPENPETCIALNKLILYLNLIEDKVQELQKQKILTTNINRHLVLNIKGQASNTEIPKEEMDPQVVTDHIINLLGNSKFTKTYPGSELANCANLINPISTLDVGHGSGHHAGSSRVQSAKKLLKETINSVAGVASSTSSKSLVELEKFDKLNDTQVRLFTDEEIKSHAVKIVNEKIYKANKLNKLKEENEAGLRQSRTGVHKRATSKFRLPLKGRMSGAGMVRFTKGESGGKNGSGSAVQPTHPRVSRTTVMRNSYLNNHKE